MREVRSHSAGRVEGSRRQVISWLDSCSDIGHKTVRKYRPGVDLQLTRYDERGWGRPFYTTGMEHSPTSATALGGSRRRGGPCSGRRGGC